VRDRGGPSAYSTFDLSLGITLFAVQLVVLLLAIAISALSGMIGDACGDGRCDTGLTEGSAWLIIIGGFALFALSVLAAGFRRARGRTSWWVPLVGTVAVIVLFAVSEVMLYAGAGQL
jgi:uncharacterized BrkB/YihY/UPF0761 family membrane protein